MFLFWLNITVSTVFEAVWYIAFAPVPARVESVSRPAPRPQHQKRPNQAPKPSAPAGNSTLPIHGTVSQPPKVISLPPRKVSFYALIIGIDKYKYPNPDFKNLHGCVIDADAMFAYLKDTLGVPPENITNLRNEKATRAAIKKNIRNLGSDPRINPGDPIFIFYAGHGGEASPPKGWEAGGNNSKIQMLIPHDFKPQTNTEDGAQGIPDITLAAMLSDIARSKGDNITVFFDSCHSGSSTRNRQNPTQVGTRSVTLPPDYKIYPNIDKDVLQGDNRKAKAASGYERTGRASHVLMAACSMNESAGDTDKGGRFTQAFLALLHDPSVRIDTLTYTDVISRLPDLPQQTPQCEGKHVARTLFNGKAPSNGRILYNVHKSNDGSFVLGAGEAQGISKKAKFSIFTSPNANTQSIGSMIAGEPQACSTKLHQIPGEQEVNFSGKSAWAIQTHVGESDTDVCVFVPPENEFLDVFQHVLKEMKEMRPGKRNVQLVDEDQSHELAIRRVDSEGHPRAAFDLTDQTSVNNGLVHLPYTVSLTGEKVYTVLSAAADFFHNLRRSNKLRPIASRVHLEAFKLKQTFLDSDPNAYTDRPIFVPDGKNLIVDGVVQIDVDEDGDHKYGFKLTNELEVPLYAWIFMFTMSDLSVETIFSPSFSKTREDSSHVGPSVHEADYSIPAKGSLTIGFGAGGTEPQSFYFPSDDQDVDITYLKVFLTSHRVDLSHVAQLSPFDDNRKPKPQVKHRKEVWDTQLLALVQKRV